MKKAKTRMEWRMKQAGLSQSELSRNLGISQPLLSYYCAGKIEASRIDKATAEKLSTYFEEPIGDLFQEI